MSDWPAFLSFRRMFTNPSSASIYTQELRVDGRGLVDVSHRGQALRIQLNDNANAGAWSISAITTANPAVITASGHTVQTGDSIAVYGVGGMTGINQVVTATSVASGTITTDYDSSAQPAYTGGGTVTNIPMMYGVSTSVFLNASRGSLPAGHEGLNGEDVAAYVAYNGSTSPYMSTEAYYLGRNASVFSTTGNYEWEGGFSSATYVKYWGFGGGSGRVGSSGAFFDASRITYDSGATWLKMPKDLYSFFVDSDGSTNAISAFKYDSTASLITFGNNCYWTGATPLQVERDQGVPQIRITGYHSSGGGNAYGRFFGRQARGTLAAPLRTKASDQLAMFGGAGFSAADDVTTATAIGAPKAYMYIVANEDQTASAQGTYLIFGTTPSGSTTAADRVRIGPSNAATFVDTSALFTLNLGSTNGTKIGASGDKIGFLGATPVAVQATTATATGFTAGTGTTAVSGSTWTGGTGTKAYNVSDIVLALKTYGLLTS